MNRFKKLTYSSVIAFLGCFLSMVAFTSCRDDFGYSEFGLGEGEALLSLDVSYASFAESSMTRSGSVAEAMKDLNDLVILVYDGNPDAEGNYNLLPQYCKMEGIDTSLAQDAPSVDNGNTGASNGKPAESNTKKLSNISLPPLPYGKYYIVGVANLKGGTKDYLEEHADDEYNYKTLDGLRRMRVTWNDVSVSKEGKHDVQPNNEMLGYFANAEEDHVPSSKSMFSLVKVNSHNVKVHAWLRRCASKITIDFDGSGLRENVYVYIKEAKIYDISEDCTLGFGQPQLNSRSEGTEDYNNTVIMKGDGIYPNQQPIGNLRQSEQVISYLRDGADPENHNIGWPCISKGMPTIRNNSRNENYAEAEDIKFHEESSDALYFYENMQGTHPTPGKIDHANIIEDQTPGGGLVENKKDNVISGTYIEVVGHYHSDADKNVTEGEIKYRFMLGKNGTDDYDAERNYHYKLTLKLMGNGNDYSWHIDYNEEKGFIVPNPWYVSYLYNHDAQLPFKYVPEDGEEVVGLKAEIINNPWYPALYSNDYELTDSNYEIKPTAPYGDEPTPYLEIDGNKYKNNDKTKPINGNGFLSLRATSETVVTPAMCNLDPSKSVDYNKDEDAWANDYNYYDVGNDGVMDRSVRVYLKDGNIVTPTYPTPDTISAYDKGRETFSWNVDKDGKSTFQIPLFTRPKVLLKKTGYSGNNPFVGYERVAKVRLTVTLKDKNGAERTDTKDVNVVQVRRVVNPKGVYRRSGNYEPFNVKLMWLAGDDANSFDPIVSHGPWKAEVIGDANFITLDGKQSVSGATNSNINFTIRFNRVGAGSAPRNAVVRILYHNYTCTHLIFVRQGYDAQSLDGQADSPTWSSFNMIAKNKMATDPRDEGSLFKFGNPGEPIDAVNNIYKDASGNPTCKVLAYGDFESLKGSVIIPFQRIDVNGDFIDGSTVEWKDIASTDDGFVRDNDFNYQDYSGFATAEVDDFEKLYLNADHEFGYGVLYADGATRTQEDVNMAYGYYRRDSENGDSEKGMRGIFAYHWDKDITGSGINGQCNGRSIFFPIGRSGYGHRKNYKEGVNGNEDGFGILRYSCNGGLPRSLFNVVAPLFVSICRSPGAIYWAKKPKANATGWDGTLLENGAPAYALDFNYLTFDVNCIVATNLNMDGKGNSPYGDACFVRSVKR